MSICYSYSKVSIEFLFSPRTNTYSFRNVVNYSSILSFWSKSIYLCCTKSTFERISRACVEFLSNDFHVLSDENRFRCSNYPVADDQQVVAFDVSGYLLVVSTPPTLCTQCLHWAALRHDDVLEDCLMFHKSPTHCHWQSLFSLSATIGVPALRQSDPCVPVGSATAIVETIPLPSSCLLGL